MPAAELAIGGRFVLEERIGRGAFGEVFRARDGQTGEVVAIKRLHEHQDDAIVLERFEREARLLARLDSPHVVRFIAYGHDERGRPCIALEWLEGTDLAQRQRAEPLSPVEAVEVVRQSALGLHALHEAGIVHRDVKPANFFLAGPTVKLIDLGIARAHAEAALTALGSSIGTPSYMSPEQARGEDKVTSGSDIFSLGVVLYELLAGRRPFTGDQSHVVLAKIVLHEPPSIHDLVADLPRELGAIVRRAMAKKPDARFASARELALALAEAPRPDHASARRKTGPVSDAPTAAQTGAALSSAVSATREQRVVTAVFAGFADAREPEQAMAIFARLAASHGGTRDRTLGWRMISIFGSARSSGDEAHRAARLALSAASIEGVQMTIATGRAIAQEGALSADAIERGAGDATRGERSILLDSATARLLAAHFWIDEVDGEHTLRGERSARSGTAPRLLGRETQMVGRDRELAALEALFGECAAEPVARVALLTGAAGAGKSRLRYELLRRFERMDAPPTVLLGRGDSLSAGSPLGMIAEQIRKAAGILDGELGATARGKLARRVSATVAAADAPRITEFLGEIAAVPFPADESPALRAARRDPVLMGDSKRLAWEDWLQAECARAPVVLVFEDLHWGDLPTVKFVDSALRNLAERPLLVLGIARPEILGQFPGLWREREVQEIRLGSLTRKACEKLVRETLGADTAEPVVASIVDRADGNAFYLEELIRAVAEGSSELPDTVLGMVQARLDALGSDGKRVLRAASVFGLRFWRGGVIALCGGDGETAAVTTALDDLATREIITRRATPTLEGKIEFLFRHALVRDAAYAMLAEDDRTAGHCLAGEWLEAAGETDAIALAEHYARGADPARALGWYRRGAEQALEGDDFAAAIERAEKGASAGAEGETLGALRLVQAEAYLWRGEGSRAIEHAKEAASLLPRGSAPWFRAIGELMTASNRQGDNDAMIAWLAEAADATAADGVEGAQIATLCLGVGQLMQTGRQAELKLTLQRVESLAASCPVLDGLAAARVEQIRGFRALRAGDPGAARESYTAAVAAFEQAGSVREGCIQRVNVGFTSLLLGDFEHAERVLRQLVTTAERMGLQTVAGYAHLNLGHVLLHLGRHAEARETEERGRAIGLSTGAPRMAGAALVHLANIAYGEGDFATAETLAAGGADTLTVAPPLRAGAIAVRARALLALGRIDEALPLAREALAIVEAGMNDMFDSLVRLVHAEALRAAGDSDGARTAIDEAKRILLEAAGRIADPALRRSFLERVPVNAATMRLAAEWGPPVC